MKDMLLSKLSLLVDEHVPIELIKLLSREGFDIKRVELGSKDKNIFELSKSEDRILITSDKHFLNKVKFPPNESSGIIFLRIHPPLIDSMHFSLKKLFNSASEFRGRLFILSLTGYKVFPRK